LLSALFKVQHSQKEVLAMQKRNEYRVEYQTREAVNSIKLIQGEIDFISNITVWMTFHSYKEQVTKSIL